MTKFSLAAVAVSIALTVFVGCSGSSAPAPKPESKPETSSGASSEIREALDKLPPDDRKIAEEQKTCPITGEPLGSMGMPVKLTLKGETVFLCCASCKKKAEANPDKTLKASAEAKAARK